VNINEYFKKMEIKKIRKQGKQMILIIPKSSEFKIGDFVKIIKIEDDEKNNTHSGEIFSSIPLNQLNISGEPSI